MVGTAVLSLVAGTAVLSLVVETVVLSLVAGTAVLSLVAGTIVLSLVAGTAPSSNAETVGQRQLFAHNLALNRSDEYQRHMACSRNVIFFFF